MVAVVAYAQQPLTVRLYPAGEVDVCASPRECVLVVDVGTVVARDSLLGYNLELRYDPEKLLFHTMLTVGTLSEAMPNRDFSARYGELRAYAFTLTRPVWGQKPLVAFLGEFRPECPDTAAVQLLWATFNEEFERQRAVSVDTAPVYVRAVVAQRPERELRMEVQERSYELTAPDTLLPLRATVRMPAAVRLQRLQTVVQGLPSWCAIEQVELAGGALEETVTDTAEVRYVWRPDTARGEALWTWGIRVRFPEPPDTVVTQVTAVTVPVDPCACITRWSGDTVRLRVLPKSVAIAPPSFEQEELQRAWVYDALGRCWVDASSKVELQRQLEQLPRGVYLLRWQRTGGSLPRHALFVR
jgi:hypothetical protein